ncbi:MAG: transketolase [Oscillospiraceae bacterium]|jgi:transketolase|nr:transketolase [Oscillospiraceae bacterium]MCI1990330.1 transketolase [Oscillospiraceae bacterium]MCI2034435.1 transketolase [Oscillospiraceae bacterium]
MDKETERRLKLTAAKVRKTGLQAIRYARSGHVGGSFSVADILTVLYFSKMNIDPEKPRWEDRDRFVLSKGHCTPAMYATLALRGFFPVEDLMGFRSADSYLSGHVEMRHVPGVDMSAGSLGQGLSAAVGMALSAKTFHKSWRTYAVTGDGEIEEGQIWEAVMAAGHYRLDNLTVFVDNNGLQLDGPIREIMSPYPIGEKFKSFGWNVLETDGHDCARIAEAVDAAAACKGRPTVIVAKTIKGKGVSFMENQVRFHGSVPTDDEFRQAFRELDGRIAELEE